MRQRECREKIKGQRMSTEFGEERRGTSLNASVELLLLFLASLCFPLWVVWGPGLHLNSEKCELNIDFGHIHNRQAPEHSHIQFAI
jgi:hypothetical protein